MKTITIAVGLTAMLALPAVATGQPSDKDRQAAQKECKQERGSTRATREAFKAEYHSMSRCVRRRAAEEEKERGQAKSNAARDCKAERKLDPEAFAEKYGANKNDRNAYGKCVSAKARENKAEMDAEDSEDAAETKNAAKRCAAEREEMGREDFADKYGTNPNKRNAFGKCVSRKTEDS